MLLDVLCVSFSHLHSQTFSCTTMNIYTIWDKISNLCNILCSIHSLICHTFSPSTRTSPSLVCLLPIGKKNFSILVSFYTARHYAYWYFQFTRCFSSIQYIFFFLFFLFFRTYTHAHIFIYEWIEIKINTSE